MSLCSIEYIEPLIWWRSLTETEQAAWAQAIGTSLAILVAILTPLISAWRKESTKRREKEKKAIHLLVAISPVLTTISAHIKFARRTISAHLEDPHNPLAWQHIGAMRVRSIKALAPYQPSFELLDGVGHSLGTVLSILQPIDSEIASMEELGPTVGVVPDLNERLEDVNKILLSLEELLESLIPGITEAARERSLLPLINRK